MKPIKILQTPVRYYPAIGGVENYVMYVSEQLVKKRYSVEVVCANVPPSKIYNHNGAIITRLHSYFNVTNTNITLGLPFYLLKCNFDIIHTHMPTPWTCDWSILIAKIRGKKSVITINNDMQKFGFFSKLITDIYLNTVFRISLYLVNKIIIVNPNWEKSFIYTANILKRYKDKITVIPNGVNSDLFKQNYKKIPNTVLFVSVLDKYHWFKGMDYALDAIKILKKKIPGIKLWIIGEGELKNKYKKKVAAMKLHETVLFFGKKLQKELVKYFSQASVFILPSTDTEGFGIVLLEALSCNTPVVASNITGVATAISKTKSGLVVKPKDADALARAVATILQKKDLAIQMGKNGRALVEKDYSWEIVTNQIITIYKSLLS